MALGTRRLLGVPIEHQGLEIIALAGLMLAAIRPTGRSHHIALILALRRDEEVGIDIAAVESVGTRQQIAHREGVRNGGSP
jgi:hypothetical protein